MPQDFSPIVAPPGLAAAVPRRPAPARPTGYLFDDGLYRALRELGLSVRIEFDIEEWKRFIVATEWPVVNAAADPAYHDFAAGEVFWMRLTHGAETIATQVFRVIMTDDYVGMVGDHSLFFGANPSRFQDFQLLAGADMPTIGGLVVQLSGLYIRPDWRRVRTADGMRLVAAWTRLSHSFAARNLMADWSVSLVEERLATPRMIQELYGYAHAGELFEAYEPALGHRERVSLMWMSAEELAGSVASRPRPVGRPAHPELHTAG
jgi:hypothetical protein